MVTCIATDKFDALSLWRDVAGMRPLSSFVCFRPTGLHIIRLAGRAAWPASLVSGRMEHNGPPDKGAGFRGGRALLACAHGLWSRRLPCQPLYMFAVLLCSVRVLQIFAHLYPFSLPNTPFVFPLLFCTLSRSAPFPHPLLWELLSLSLSQDAQHTTPVTSRIAFFVHGACSFFRRQPRRRQHVRPSRG